MKNVNKNAQENYGDALKPREQSAEPLVFPHDVTDLTRSALQTQEAKCIYDEDKWTNRS